MSFPQWEVHSKHPKRCSSGFPKQTRKTLKTGAGGKLKVGFFWLPFQTTRLGSEATRFATAMPKGTLNRECVSRVCVFDFFWSVSVSVSASVFALAFVRL